ncbi:MAG TPA: RDD family protein [Terriglobia bacterium]|nr:RDD family protein [Terriglobia bacterium]
MSVLGIGIEQERPKVIGAGFWIRALARITDSLYCTIIGFVTGVCSAITLTILQRYSVIEPGWAHRMPHFIALLPASLLGTIIYHAISEGVYGASAGKFVFALRVLSESRTPCDIPSAFLREIAYFFDALFFGLVGYLSMDKTPLQQRYGDHWAGTIVVRTADVPPESRRSGRMFAFSLILASFACALPMWIAVVLVAAQ